MSIQNIVFLSVLAFPAGLLLGGAVAFVGVPLYYRMRAIPPQARRFSWKYKCALSIGAGVAAAVLICALEWGLAQRAAHSFQDHMGSEGFWRIPLHEPYELQMRATMDRAQISTWRQRAAQISHITHCIIVDDFVAGICASPADTWFLFDSATGRYMLFHSRGDLVAACIRTGIVLPAWMNTVRHNWYVYWGIVDAARIDAHRISVFAP